MRLVICLFAFFVSNLWADVYQAFDDGLGSPNSVIRYDLDDLDDGISRVEIFDKDLDNDGILDRITKFTNHNISAHGFFQYDLELSDGNSFYFIASLKTIEGADGAVQKIKFVFDNPVKVVKIFRPVIESYITPSLAIKEVFQIENKTMNLISSQELSLTDDVAKLF